MFATTLHALALIFSGLFILFLLVGFFRGLSLPPNKAGQRGNGSNDWWFWSRD